MHQVEKERHLGIIGGEVVTVQTLDSESMVKVINGLEYNMKFKSGKSRALRVQNDKRQHQHWSLSKTSQSHPERKLPGVVHRRLPLHLAVVLPGHWYFEGEDLTEAL